MGVSKASFASAEEMAALTGMQVGGVTRFSLPHGMPLYVDDRMIGLDWIILGGIWLQRGGAGGPMSEWSKEPLPFTPAGLAKFNANKPGKGPRTVVPAKGNDPLSDANVPGLLRTLVYARPFQIIPLADKIVQIFEWDRTWREIR